LRRAVVAAAAVLVAGCGGGDDGGQVHRVESLQECLRAKQLTTNVTRDEQLVGAKERADVVSTTLRSPNGARLYVFDSAGDAEAAQAGSPIRRERRDNVIVVYAAPPIEADRDVLDECFRGDF
jgi:hypothetical protein